MRITEEITPPEPEISLKPEHYHRKRRIVEQVQPHNTSYHNPSFSKRFMSPSPSELERRAMIIQTEKDRLHQKSVRDIITFAAEAAAAEEAAAVAEAKAKTDAATENARKKDKSNRKTLTSEEREANKEKRLLKLIGAVVVKCMSKYSKSFDHDAFKKHAKEV